MGGQLSKNRKSTTDVGHSQAFSLKNTKRKVLASCLLYHLIYLWLTVVSSQFFTYERGQTVLLLISVHGRGNY